MNYNNAVKNKETALMNKIVIGLNCHPTQVLLSLYLFLLCWIEEMSPVLFAFLCCLPKVYANKDVDLDLCYIQDQEQDVAIAVNWMQALYCFDLLH